MTRHSEKKKSKLFYEKITEKNKLKIQKQEKDLDASVHQR